MGLTGRPRPAAPGAALTVLASDHASVLEPARHLETEGYELRLAPVGPEGLVDVEELARTARGSALPSLAAANNETGALVPLGEVREALGDEALPIHTDAAQALGRIPLDLTGWGVDLASLSALRRYRGRDAPPHHGPVNSEAQVAGTAAAGDRCDLRELVHPALLRVGYPGR